MKKVEKFFAKSPAKKYRKRTLLLRPDEPISKIFYLSSGNVRQYVISPDAEEFVIHVFKPGSFFPISLVLGDADNRYYFEALNDIEVKAVSPEKVTAFLRQDGESLMDLTKRLSRGLNGIVARYEQSMASSAKNRLLSLLAYLSKSFGESSRGERKINLSLTHQDLAAWLGLSRETVSRQMKILAKERLISYASKTIKVLSSKKM